ncbi:hypothetical protein HK102_004107 [Quaeritorhiza haematococci]|nr:hypothetical protein HK102_004107 [Quaeritorhiza haematococci]
MTIALLAQAVWVMAHALLFFFPPQKRHICLIWDLRNRLLSSSLRAADLTETQVTLLFDIPRLVKAGFAMGLILVYAALSLLLLRSYRIDAFSTKKTWDKLLCVLNVIAFLAGFTGIITGVLMPALLSVIFGAFATCFPVAKLIIEFRRALLAFRRAHPSVPISPNHAGRRVLNKLCVIFVLAWMAGGVILVTQQLSNKQQFTNLGWIGFNTATFLFALMSALAFSLVIDVDNAFRSDDINVSVQVSIVVPRTIYNIIPTEPQAGSGSESETMRRSFSQSTKRSSFASRRRPSVPLASQSQPSSDSSKETRGQQTKHRRRASLGMKLDTNEKDKLSVATKMDSVDQLQNVTNEMPQYEDRDVIEGPRTPSPPHDPPPEPPQHSQQHLQPLSPTAPPLTPTRTTSKSSHTTMITATSNQTLLWHPTLTLSTHTSTSTPTSTPSSHFSPTASVRSPRSPLLKSQSTLSLRGRRHGVLSTIMTGLESDLDLESTTNVNAGTQPSLNHAPTTGSHSLNRATTSTSGQASTSVFDNSSTQAEIRGQRSLERVMPPQFVAPPTSPSTYRRPSNYGL